MNKPLSDAIEENILDHVMQLPDGSVAHDWPTWFEIATRSLTEPYNAHDIRAAFERLRKEGHLALLKWQAQSQMDVDYTEYKPQSAFYYTGMFRAAVTPDGGRHWDRLRFRRRNGVFISHITEEKPIALLLQKYLRLAFGDDFRVFVSSDARSITGGKKWYPYILENLLQSEVVLVLVSQESKAREWINFEAGVGEGAESLVIPIAIKNMSLGQLSLPLQGIQGRSIDAFGTILDEIGNRVRKPPLLVDFAAFQSDLREAEATLIYRSLSIEPVISEDDYLVFLLQNQGNIDLELLMLEAFVPASVLPDNLNAILQSSPVYWDCGYIRRSDTEYAVFRCYSQRGTCRNVVPFLRPVITPSMGKVPIGIPTMRTCRQMRLALKEGVELMMYYKLHAIGYRTEEEAVRLSDVLTPSSLRLSTI